MFLKDDNVNNKLLVEELLWVGQCVKYCIDIISFNPDIIHMIVYIYENWGEKKKEKGKLRTRDIMTQEHSF